MRHVLRDRPSRYVLTDEIKTTSCSKIASIYKTRKILYRLLIMAADIPSRSSRFAAIETLVRLQKTRLPVSRIFECVVDECALRQTDRHLAMKICYGVLRQRDYLNYIIAELCNRSTTKLKPFVYQALSTGLYQLFFLDRIPPSAAVNETVKAVKTARLPKPIQGFVNGVLRAGIRNKEKLVRPDDMLDGHPFLNHPQWLYRRWQQQYGMQQMQRICSWNNKDAVTCLRVTHKISVPLFLEMLEEKGIPAEAGNYAPNSVLVKDYQGSVTSLPGFENGLFQVQDQSAQLATLLLAPFTDNESYLDCCAGLGGKTTHLASLLADLNCSITALEPAPGRFRQLEENLARTTDTGKIAARNETLERFSRSCMTRFEKILVDAPCSGSGVTGRHPDIRWNRDEKDIHRFGKRQLSLLDLAAQLLMPGGILVYVTCSIEKEENRDVVDSFLNSHPDFTLTDCSRHLPPAASSLVRDKCFSPTPADGTDGFFAARLTLRP